MKLPRRQFLHLAAGATALSAVSRVARAQAYPRRYVRLVVQFPPGGASDPLARVIANRLSEVWGQEVVVENKGGAGGNLGTAEVDVSSTVGYTLLMGVYVCVTLVEHVRG